MIIPFTLTDVAEAHRERNGLDKFDLVGFLDTMLSDSNPAHAQEQLDAAYQHGGGFRPFNGFALKHAHTNEPVIAYPGDPPMRAIAIAQLRDERVILFESAWVAVVQSDGSFVVSRMD